METFALIVNLFVLEGLLSVDNAAVLAVMVRDLPEVQSKRALRYGLIGAYAMRGVCLWCASWLAGIWWLKVAGGMYLCYLAIQHFSGKAESKNEIKKAHERGIYKWLAGKGISVFWTTVVLVELMDLAFSLDNVFAAVALSNKLWVVVVGVFLGIAAMRVIAWWFVEVMKRYPVLEVSAYLVIGILGVKLLLSGFAVGMGWSVVITVLEDKLTSNIFPVAMMVIFFAPMAWQKMKHLQEWR